MTARQYCLGRSWRLRLRRRDSEWLIEEAVAMCNLHIHKPLWLRGAGLLNYLSGRVREEYGNPILIWFLLNVIVPVVVRLVIEWWLNRRESLQCDF